MTEIRNHIIFPSFEVGPKLPLSEEEEQKKRQQIVSNIFDKWDIEENLLVLQDLYWVHNGNNTLEAHIADVERMIQEYIDADYENGRIACEQHLEEVRAKQG